MNAEDREWVGIAKMSKHVFFTQAVIDNMFRIIDEQQQRIDEAPHEEFCLMDIAGVDIPKEKWICRCWKSSA